MDTPVLDALEALDVALRQALVRVKFLKVDRDILEVALQDKLNSKFGNTEETLSFLNDLSIGLRNFRKKA